MEKQQLAEVAVNRIERVFKTEPEFRRAHARGITFEGLFTPNGQAEEYTAAPHLQNEEIKTAVRFSHSSPNPNWNDVMSPVKGMAVQFQLPNGAVTNIVGVNSPIFFAKTPEVFTEMLGIVKSFQNGKPRLRELVKLLVKYPESRAGVKVIRKMHAPASFATGRYYAMHAFYFTNRAGHRTPIKYEWEPAAGVDTLSPADAAALKIGHYESEIEERLNLDAVRFQLNIVIGEEGDPTDDPTQEWPEERRKITVGELAILPKQLDSDLFLFDPTVMAEGVACSDDRILNFRHAAYSVSNDRRTAENKNTEAD